MGRFRRRWLQPGEAVQWRATSNHGPWNHRQVAGHVFVTDRRFVFRPLWIELITQEVPWEAPLSEVSVAIGPGQWVPRLRLLRFLALRYDIQVVTSDGAEEHFFVTHLGEPIERLAQGNIPDLRGAKRFGTRW